MPRKNFICNPEAYYHVWNRCINKEWFEQPLDEVWDIFCIYLYMGVEFFNIEIISFVLMDNHYHILLKAPKGNLSEAMRYMFQHISLDLLKNSRRINQVFARRFGRSEIISDHYFRSIYKYVYYNPKEANIVSQVENYKYSTLSSIIGKTRQPFPINDYIAPCLFSETIKWLNSDPKKDHMEAIRRGLQKSKFKLPKKDYPKSKLLEYELL